jgi:hypothetical protein
MAVRSDGPSPARHLVHDGKDMVIMLGLALLTVAGIGTWLWGESAALLTRGALPRVPVSQSLSIALRLPGHLRDPREAWPTNAAALLPDSTAFYCAGAVLLVIGCVLVLAGARVWVRFKRRDDGFATRKDLAVHLAETAVIKRGPVVRPSLSTSPFALTDVGLPLGRSVPDKVRLAVSTEAHHHQCVRTVGVPHHVAQQLGDHLQHRERGIIAHRPRRQVQPGSLPHQAARQYVARAERQFQARTKTSCFKEVIRHATRSSPIA